MAACAASTQGPLGLPIKGGTLLASIAVLSGQGQVMQWRIPRSHAESLGQGSGKGLAGALAVGELL